MDIPSNMEDIDKVAKEQLGDNLGGDLLDLLKAIEGEKLIGDVGGKFGGIHNISPFKSYKYYVDFGYMIKSLAEIDMDVLIDNWHKLIDKDKKESEESGVEGLGGLIRHTSDFYNIGAEGDTDTSKRSLDFGFYVNSVNLPKYSMKTVKINTMDSVKNREIKTSYSGEINLTIASTFHNITEISLLLGLFSYYDTFDIWNIVYKSEVSKGISPSEASNLGHLDIVLVDDGLKDSLIYRLINPIITNVDFGSFSYGTNALNEVRMTIAYNSWYVEEGGMYELGDENGSTWDVKAYTATKKFLDGIFGTVGKGVGLGKLGANWVGSHLPWG